MSKINTTKNNVVLMILESNGNTKTIKKQFSKLFSYEIYIACVINNIDYLELLNITNNIQFLEYIIKSLKITIKDKHLIISHIIKKEGRNILLENDIFNRNILFYIKKSEDYFFLQFLLARTNLLNKLSSNIDIFGKNFLYYYLKNTTDNFQNKSKIIFTNYDLIYTDNRLKHSIIKLL